MVETVPDLLNLVEELRTRGVLYFRFKDLELTLAPASPTVEIAESEEAPKSNEKQRWRNLSDDQLAALGL